MASIGGANSGPSAMGLQTDEVISLRNLLYGNMMVSAGDATWAISEHVANNLGNMITRMNNKAFALGLTNTTHCQEGTSFSSVAYSTPRDQVALWEAMYEHPQFLEFAGRAQQFGVCGDLNGQAVCHPSPQPMAHTMTFYPNLEGHKTGGGGGLCSAPQFDNIPTCVGGGCVTLQTTRLGRSLLTNILEPANGNINRWTDATVLLDWAYQSIFTPDFRGESAAVAVDYFALDFISEFHSVTSALTGGQSVRVCNWATDVGAGDAESMTCTTMDFTGLSHSARVLPARRMDIVRVSTLLSEGDYMVGELDDNSQLRLSTYRIGAK